MQSKQRRNPQKTKAKIMKAATSLFAKGGFHGTSLSNLLKMAKVNNRMIYHYFGNKEGLYHEVFKQQWKLLSEYMLSSLMAIQHKKLSAPEQMKRLVRRALEAFFDFMASHQSFTRLLMWEGLEGGKISRKIWKEVSGPLFREIEGLVKLAQKQKMMDPKLKPAHMVMNFMGMVFHYFSNADAIEDKIGQPPLSGPALKEAKTQMICILENLYRV